MIFKIKATLTCRRCSFTKIFNAQTDIFAIDTKDGEDIAAWGDDVNPKRIALEGICPHCSFKNAA